MYIHENYSYRDSVQNNFILNNDDVRLPNNGKSYKNKIYLKIYYILTNH